MAEKPKTWKPRVIEGGANNHKTQSIPRETDQSKHLTVTIPNISREESLLRDLHEFLKNIDKFKEVPKRMDEITDFIFSLVDYANNSANIDIRRKGLSSSTMNELADHILESKEADWNTHPSFYGAVILEYTSRIERLRENLPKE